MSDLDTLTFAVLLGSVRVDRMAARAGGFIEAALRRHGHAAHLVDPMALKLPLLDRMYKEHPKGEAPAPLEALATLYSEVDGFVIVSGEYNNGIPPALKNLLDYFLEEYFWRPSAIVCYSAGQYGGVRAAMQLRMTLAELGMPSIPSILPIPRVGQAIDETGAAQADWLGRSADRFLGELAWYSRALRRERAGGTPY
jgi:NAD(P)H-dependent FMN reductase